MGAESHYHDPPRKSTPHNPPSSTPSEFSHSLTKIAVAQILRSLGFTSAQSSALQTLTNITALYIHSLGSRAFSHANSRARTQCNVFDVISAVEDLGLTAGFPTAADLNVPLLHSYTIKELQWFVDGVDEVPFPRRIPRPQPPSGSPSWAGKAGSLEGRGTHLPEPGFGSVGRPGKACSLAEPGFGSAAKSGSLEGRVAHLPEPGFGSVGLAGKAGSLDGRAARLPEPGLGSVGWVGKEGNSTEPGFGSVGWAGKKCSLEGRAAHLPEPGSESVGWAGKEGSLARRGAHVPTWLPGFPDVGGELRGVSKGERYWEEGGLERGVTMVEMVKEEKSVMKRKKKKGEGGFELKGRRERVKFKVGSLKNGKVGGVEGLKLRNGVCRGGKRVCLGRKVKMFVLEDEEEKESDQSEIGKSRVIRKDEG